MRQGAGDPDEIVAVVVPGPVAGDPGVIPLRFFGGRHFLDRFWRFFGHHLARLRIVGNHFGKGLVDGALRQYFGASLAAGLASGLAFRLASGLAFGRRKLRTSAGLGRRVLLVDRWRRGRHCANSRLHTWLHSKRTNTATEVHTPCWNRLLMTESPFQLAPKVRFWCDALRVAGDSKPRQRSSRRNLP